LLHLTVQTRDKEIQIQPEMPKQENYEMDLDDLPEVTAPSTHRERPRTIYLGKTEAEE